MIRFRRDNLGPRILATLIAAEKGLPTALVFPFPGRSIKEIGFLRFVPACGLAESRRPFVRNGVLRDPVPDGQGSDSVAGGTAAPLADRRDADAPPLGGRCRASKGLVGSLGVPLGGRVGRLAGERRAREWKTGPRTGRLCFGCIRSPIPYGR